MGNVNKTNLSNNVLPLAYDEEPTSISIDRQARKIRKFVELTYEAVTVSVESPVITHIENPGIFTLVKESFHKKWKTTGTASIFPTLRGFSLLYNPGNETKVTLQYTQLPLMTFTGWISLGGLLLLFLYSFIVWLWERKNRFQTVGSGINFPPVEKLKTPDPSSR